MARKPRYCPGGYVYHVLNRSAGRITLFRRDEDYAAMDGHTRRLRRMLSPGPQGRWPGLAAWTESVNGVPTKKELIALATSEKRSCPYGREVWAGKTVVRLGLEHTVRREGRPAQPRHGGLK
jgi:hypothetical protein